VANTLLSVKGQVVIPKRIRELLGLQPGDRLVVRVDGDAIVLKPARKGVAYRLFGRCRDLGLRADLKAEHRAELTRDLRRA